MFVTKTEWEKCVQFHGHECPGLAIGFRACEAAMDKLGLGRAADEEVVCVTETDACGVDAIQVIAGCSLGKGNLIYRGTGKQAFSFFNKTADNKVRVVLKPLNRSKDMKEMQEFILSSPADELFDFKEPQFTVPEPARIFTTVICEICGEAAAENKMRLKEGKKCCVDCFGDYTRGW